MQRACDDACFVRGVDMLGASSIRFAGLSKYKQKNTVLEGHVLPFDLLKTCGLWPMLNYYRVIEV
jgi:hypothetical protein